MSNQEQPEQKPPTFWQIVFSTFAAAFGVQSSKNRERDFKHGSIKVYATAGVIFTVMFVLTVVFIVKQVLKAAGVE